MARQDSDEEDYHKDDFWNKSNVKSFNFDDDEEEGQLFGVSKSGTSRLSQQLRATLPGEEAGISSDSLSGSLAHTTVPVSSSYPPLLSLISHTSLNLSKGLTSLPVVLEADLPQLHEKKKLSTKPDEELRMLRRQAEERWNEPPVEITIKKIFLGRPHSLESYRSFGSKKLLLEAAINLGDGNAILEVVLFLVHSLKRSLLQQLLVAHPIAAAHYVKHLATRFQISELTDLLEMLGRSQDAAMKNYQMAISSQSPRRQLEKLRACISSYFAQGDTRLCQLIKNHLALLEWQQGVGTIDKVDLLGKSVMECLAHACQQHWEDQRSSPMSPFALGQKHGISDRQLQWTILTERAELKKWSDIDSEFITKNWLGSGSKLKLALPIKAVIIQLHSKGAPNEVLLRYLGFIDNLEQRMSLARQINCYIAVIDGYKTLRDRQGLQGYKATLHPQSEAFLFAEDALRIATIKWKN